MSVPVSQLGSRQRNWLWPVRLVLLGSIGATPFAGPPIGPPIGPSAQESGDLRAEAEQQPQEGEAQVVPPKFASGMHSEDPRTWRSEKTSLKLSLEDALGLAMRDNLSLLDARGQTEIARFDAQGSWGAFDPILSATVALVDREQEGSSSLSGADLLKEDSQQFSTALVWPVRTGAELSLSYSRNNNRTNNQFATFDVSTTDVVTAMVTQPLLRGAWERFATTAQRESKVGYLKQQATQNQVQQQLLLDVYNAYWDLVSARDQLDVQIVTYELGQQQLLQDQRRLDVGAGTEVDVLQSETNLALTWENLLQSANSVLAGEDTLRQILFQESPFGGDRAEQVLTSWDWPILPSTGLPEVDRDDVPRLDAQGVEPTRWREALSHAVQYRPELIQARFDVEAAEVRLEDSRSNRRAQLDLELTATSVGFDVEPSDAFSEASGFEFPEYRGALVFSLPLGNRTARNANRSARAALRNAKLQYDIRELEILSSVRSAVRDVRFRAMAAMASETSSQLAERQLAAEQARQRSGLSTTFQVLEFQKTLSEARSKERASRADYAKALAGLRFAEGLLGEGSQGELPEGSGEGARLDQGSGAGAGEIDMEPASDSPSSEGER